MNYFDVQNNFLTITPQKANTEKIVEAVNKYISKVDCEKMCVDISALNLIEAVKLGALCSAHHFSKYPFGELEWVVRDKETCAMLKPFSLKTVKTCINRPIIRDIKPLHFEKVVAIR